MVSIQVIPMKKNSTKPVKSLEIASSISLLQNEKFWNEEILSKTKKFELIEKVEEYYQKIYGHITDFFEPMWFPSDEFIELQMGKFYTCLLEEECFSELYLFEEILEDLEYSKSVITNFYSSYTIILKNSNEIDFFNSLTGYYFIPVCFEKVTVQMTFYHI